MASKRKKPVKKKKKATRKTKSSRKKKNRRVERDLDEGLMETFPGSDAVAVTDPTRGIKE